MTVASSLVVGEQESEAEYRRLVENDDVDGVMELLTNRAVEERVLQVGTS